LRINCKNYYILLFEIILPCKSQWTTVRATGLGPPCPPRLRCRGSAPARCRHGRVSRAVVGAGDAVPAVPGRRVAWATRLCAVAGQPHPRRGHRRRAHAYAGAIAPARSRKPPSRVAGGETCRGGPHPSRRGRGPPRSRDHARARTARGLLARAAGAGGLHAAGARPRALPWSGPGHRASARTGPRAPRARARAPSSRGRCGRSSGSRSAAKGPRVTPPLPRAGHPCPCWAAGAAHVSCTEGARVQADGAACHTPPGRVCAWGPCPRWEAEAEAMRRWDQGRRGRGRGRVAAPKTCRPRATVTPGTSPRSQDVATLSHQRGGTRPGDGNPASDSLAGEICHYGCLQMRLRRFGGIGEGFSIMEN
jgi:hypothetical protein